MGVVGREPGETWCEGPYRRGDRSRLAELLLQRPMTGLRSYLVRAMSIALRAARIVPVWALALAACGGAEDASPPDSTEKAAAIASATAEAPRAGERPEGKPLGHFRMTFYYVIGEDEVGDSPRRLVARAGDAEREPSAPAVTPELAAAPAETSETTEPTEPAPTELVAPADTELAAAAPIAQPAEAEAAPAEAEIATDEGDQRTAIYDKRCNELARVTDRFLYQLKLQGTGKLRDGRVLNIWGACPCPHSPCYRLVNKKRTRWGYGGSGRSLSPFRTAAVDPARIKLGALLYIPALDGLTMPGHPPHGGFVHDGCVVADDTGGGIRGAEIDLFVGRRAYYLGLARRGSSHAWAKKVEVFDGSTRCKRSKGHVSSRSQRGAI